MALSLNCPNCGATLGLNLGVVSLNSEPQIAPLSPKVEAQPRVGGVRSSKLRFNYENPYFKSFWDIYPRRIGKASAYSTFLKVIVEIEPQIVIDAAAQYAKEVEAQGLEARYIPYPQVWLNAGRWDDEIPAAPSAVKTPEESDAEWERQRQEDDEHIAALLTEEPE